MSTGKRLAANFAFAAAGVVMAFLIAELLKSERLAAPARPMRAAE